MKRSSQGGAAEQSKQKQSRSRTQSGLVRTYEGIFKNIFLKNPCIDQHPATHLTTRAGHVKCMTKPGGSNTTKQKHTLGNYKPGEKRKRLNTNNGAALSGVILWPDNEAE